MRLILRLAWRNVWRNPRRTGLTVSATVFAVLLVIVFVSMGAGIHEQMIEDAVRLSSGHASISGRGYLENRTLEQFIDFDPELARQLDATEGVVGWAPRVVGFGLLSSGPDTHGIAVLGVDPDRERWVTTLPERVRDGRFIGQPGGREIVLGARLAKSLEVGLGDEVLLYSVAYSLEMAYELFTVVGTMKLPDSAMERGLAVVHIADAQAFFVYGDRVTEVAILAGSADDTAQIVSAVSAGVGDEVEVHGWPEIMPELVQFIFLDDAGMYIMLLILVVVVAFGILNTLLMSVLERRREFGVALALGLRPRAIFVLVYLESMALAALGLALGLGIALPLVLYLVGHPIDLDNEAMKGAYEMLGFEPRISWKLKPTHPLGSAITIFGVAALAALYPAFKASRARPVDALRSV
ncbi:MAG: ABC transporter permease [Deltaproteobacteria bacterium]|nr:ABC transporter permease [Deltaproteobacteria bacterium]